ncbi:flavohemoglobin expression-modulating QEGLA motif protein [Planctomycetota bacterium]
MLSTPDKKPLRSETIPPNLVAKIVERLSEGKRVRRSLPQDGRVHIDRTLPFMVVYRHPPEVTDPGTQRLVWGEASYLVASGAKSFYPGLTELISLVVATLANECESFLLIEVWAASEPIDTPEAVGGVVPPSFRIVAPKADPPTRTVEALERALKRIKIQKRPAAVTVDYVKSTGPPGIKPLLSTREAHLRNCFVIGLEVQPIYRDASTGELYPLVLRSLHRGLSVALKRAAFEFARNRTPRRPANYQALGRRAFVKAVWKVDQQLARISQSFDFLLQVTPINADVAWKRFRQTKYEKTPSFLYRPLPIDPALVKRRLYQVPIEQIEDPTLASLFREKRMELDRQLTLLLDRGHPAFLYGSQQLFGGVSADLVALAQQILASFSARSREDSSQETMDAWAFAERARAEIDYYRSQRGDAAAQVQVREDITGIMVSQGNLLIGRSLKVPAVRAEALLQHEVGTHVLTYLNGQAQPLQLLCCGLAGYEALQEGLAVLAEYLVGGLGRMRLRLLAGRALAVHSLIAGASFVETFRELNQTHGFKQEVAFGIAVRVYRGGGLTKDAVYLQGLATLLDYLHDDGDLQLLLVGKIAADHIPIVRELLSRKVLIPASLQPRYLQDKQVQARLAGLHSGTSVPDLIDRRNR